MSGVSAIDPSASRAGSPVSRHSALLQAQSANESESQKVPGQTVRRQGMKLVSRKRAAGGEYEEQGSAIAVTTGCGSIVFRPFCTVGVPDQRGMTVLHRLAPVAAFAPQPPCLSPVAPLSLARTRHRRRAPHASNRVRTANYWPPPSTGHAHPFVFAAVPPPLATAFIGTSILFSPPSRRKFSIAPPQTFACGSP